MLIENTTLSPAWVAEHGLSLLVETAGQRVLFDTGASAAFADNAERMGIDLFSVDAVVLSHGHVDHGGGLSRFLELNSHAPVWVSPYAFEPHYNASGRDSGLTIIVLILFFSCVQLFCIGVSGSRGDRGDDGAVSWRLCGRGFPP